MSVTSRTVPTGCVKNSPRPLMRLECSPLLPAQARRLSAPISSLTGLGTPWSSCTAPNSWTSGVLDIESA
jgi:hypothetical protein